MMILSRAAVLIRSWLRITIRWSRPSYGSAAPLAEEEWRRQHDEISQTIRRTASTLIASCLFCLLTLGAGDENLVSADAKIHIPVANTDVSYTGFLLFGPIVLIGLSFYLHVFLEQLLHLGPSKGREPLPFMFNIARSGARLLSGLVFYWMVPAVLAVFTWKALPRAEAPLLVLLTTCAAAIMVALQIRRFRSERSSPLTLRARTLLGALWLLWAVLLVFPVLQLAWLARPLLLRFSATAPGDFGAQVVVPVGHARGRPLLLPTRRLLLYNATLHNKNLSGLNAPEADLRKANLKEADLEGAVLAHADLRKADLTGANLVGVDLRDSDLQGTILSQANLGQADLRGAKIDDYTKIEGKWKTVWCIVNRQVDARCRGNADLAWTDLGRADLHAVSLPGAVVIGADLKDADLRNADLSRADLRLADLTGADLRGADLRGTHLPPSVDRAKVSGVRRDGGSVTQAEATVILFSRTTESCLAAPKPADNDRLPSLSASSGDCRKSADPRLQWKVRRLGPGYVIFRSAVPGSSDKPACLDGTGGSANKVKVHMWECSVSDGYENQHWKIARLDDGYVSLEKRETKFCLDSTGIREAGANPHLWDCSESVHNQHWQMVFPDDRRAGGR